MKTKIRIIIAAALFIVIAIAFWRLNFSTPAEQVPVVPTTDPVDFVLDFYNDWSTVLVSSTDPFASELFTSAVLSDSLRDALRTAKTVTPEVDPITCQTGAVQDQFRVRAYPATETEVKLLVESRIEKQTQPMMAFVTVVATNGQWQLSAIECTTGDVAPEVKFTYNQEGFLLSSVPPPFEAGKWHLVFEQDGQMGHVTPLFISTTTTCVARTGEVSLCNTSTFIEASRAVVKGEMTELGAEVSQIEFLP